MSENIVKKLTEGIRGFAADMRAQGIHVGLGHDPHCVTCGEAWPCAASQEEAVTALAGQEQP